MDSSTGCPGDALAIPEGGELASVPLDEALLGSIDHLEAVVVPLHPDIQPDFDHYRYITTGERGQRVYVQNIENEGAEPQEGEISITDVEADNLVIVGIDESGQPAGTINYSPTSHSPVLIASSLEELQAKTEQFKEQQAYRQHVIETHRLGRGGPTLINSLGGLSVGSDEAVHDTAKDFVIRSVTAVKFGCKTTIDLTEQKFLDPVLTQILGDRLAPLIQEASKSLSVLDQLPEESRPTVGKPLLEVFFNKVKALVAEAEPEILVVASMRAVDNLDLASKAATKVEHERQDGDDKKYHYSFSHRNIV